MNHYSQTMMYKLEAPMRRYATMTDMMMACHFINKGRMERNELVKKNNRAHGLDTTSDRKLWTHQ